MFDLDSLLMDNKPNAAIDNQSSNASSTNIHSNNSMT